MSVITLATEKIVDKLAEHYEVTKTRMYELLGNQCVYPKFKRLIRTIGLFNKEGVQLIRNDLDLMFDEILGEVVIEKVRDCDLHCELSEAVTACLAGKTRDEKLKELREAERMINRKILEVEHLG